MYYRMGWPLGRMIARLGVPTLIRIDVIKDSEAGVFVGTSEDLNGLVVEADSLEALLQEAHDLIPCLLDVKTGSSSRSEIIPSLRYNDCHA